jgi:ribonuclease HI
MVKEGMHAPGISKEALTTLENDENKMTTFYVDGQSIGNENVGQPRKARTALAFRWEGTAPEAPHVRVVSEELGDKTNNEAEYHALIRLLSILRDHLPRRGGELRKMGEVKICSDSELLVKQMKGEYKVKEERLKQLRDEAKQMIEEMESVRLEWISRDENLAGLWLEGKIRAIQVRPNQFLLGM